MTAFSTHLQALIDGIDDKKTLPQINNNEDVDKWVRYSNDLGPVDEHLLTIEPNEQRWISVLDLPWSTDEIVSKTGPSSSDNPINDLYSRLAADPQTAPLIPSLAQLLSSPKRDEEISEELAELLGFDAIELVMEIISNRLPLSYKLAIVGDGDELPNSGRALGRSGKATPQSGRATPSKKDKRRQPEINGLNFSLEDARRRMERSFEVTASRPLFSGTAEQAPEVLPHVYTSSTIVQGNLLSMFGSKYLLPLGTTREDRDDCEEVTVPPSKPIPPRETERLIPVTELDGLARGAFPGYTSLNRIQSIVYPTAYGTNENLLICAPTGAGKTDVAMLTILRVIDQNLTSWEVKSSPEKIAGSIRRDDFKIIYVAPMKALAAEIVRKLGKRLAWLSIRVRELTGDMQMTKAEIAETQIIVTTPEKWDVVTRKPTGEGELASKVKLLIIDEVHLLNEERGAVIETIVARTLRQVESTQSLIRVVGLSATLPNYIDVADFLRVSRQHGLFYFDSSFRPIPLEQHFIGIKGKPNSPQARRNLDRVTFQKVLDLVREGHQVMVFVHARKETVKSAQTLREMAMVEGALDDFSTKDHPIFHLFKRDIGMSRNKEMKELFNDGFGIHHAGMLRSDRNMMERMFEAKAIKVLCCTATLAWGVNLPAHAAIIKGTQVYDSSRGSFVDLSVLDVLQIFGRAGRPGMESSGEGYICTSEDKLTHYLDAVTAQHPIESKFVAGMVDALNAEISLGTVTNTNEAIQWVGYTYLFVRMRRNPFVYGMTHDEPIDDPQLGHKRHQLVKSAAQRLAEAGMITYIESTGSLSITDLGRIAAKYYIRVASIEIFNKEFKPLMTEADVLGLLSLSTEFDQVQLRENEVKELKHLMEEVIPCEVKGGIDTTQGKVNILLQGYISKAHVEDFALVSDMAYVAQNGGRIIRGLFEIALSRKWATVCTVLLAMSKAVEKRMWPYEHPLSQFDLSPDVLYNLQRWADELSVAELASQSAERLGQLIHMNERHGTALLKAAKQFPFLNLIYHLRPLSADLLKLSVRFSMAFEWNTRLHGSTEPFWIWIEDCEGVEIIQRRHVLVRQDSASTLLDFIIPIRGSKPPLSVTLRYIADRWMGAEDEITVILEDLSMPAFTDCHTRLLDLPFLPVADSILPSINKLQFRVFNGMQTQFFWTLMHTSQNVLICGSAVSGKSTMAMLSVCQTLHGGLANSYALILAPSRSQARELASLYRISQGSSRLPVDLLFLPDALVSKRGKGIRITTTQCLLRSLFGGLQSTVDQQWLSDLKVVVCECLELLDSTYEFALSILLHETETLPVRYLGLAYCLNDPTDLANWLHIPSQAMFSFRARDREQFLSFKTVSFSIPHSAALFKAMAKPAYTAITETPEDEPGLIFVPSRSHCHNVAADLITQCGIDMKTTGFLRRNTPVEALESYLLRIQNHSLHDFISHGIGVFHEGIHRSDLSLMLQLYLEGVIRILIVPREACWAIPVHAGIVIVMGTQYIRFNSGPGRRIQGYSVQEVARMQACAIRPGKYSAFHIFCQDEQRDTFTHFLDEGLPLESELMDSADTKIWLEDMKKTGSTIEKQDYIDVLSYTYLFHRISSNPVYYNSRPGQRSQDLSRFVDGCWESQG